MLDSEPIKTSRQIDDFGTIIFEIMSKINYKMVFFLVFVYLLISSDVFINRILSGFNGAVDGKTATNYGTFLQALFLVIFYISMDVFINTGVV